MKLCKNCRHFRRATLFNNDPMCGRTISPVDGKPENTCKRERQTFFDTCGRDGHFYEPKRAIFGIVYEDHTDEYSAPEGGRPRQ